jgi:hypothetical protein
VSEASVSEVLNLAADVLEARGWLQGGDIDVNPWGYQEAATAPLCVEGAIHAALVALVPDDVVRKHSYTRVVNVCPAGAAVREYLGMGPYGADTKPLYRWNDADNRTMAEVVEVLRATALIATAREAKTEVPA